MKKIILGILSIFLISPVFAESLSNRSTNNIFEFSNLSYPYRYIYYAMSNDSYSTFGLQSNNHNIYTITSLTGSQYTGFGSVYDSNSVSSILNYSSFVGHFDNGFTGNFLFLKDKSVSSNRFSKLYIQRKLDDSFSGSNFLFKLGQGQDNIGSFDDYDVLSSSYSRYFYNSQSFPTDSTSVEHYETFYFNQNYFNTELGNVYLPGQNNIGSMAMNWHNGFSYIVSRNGGSMSWSDLQFYTVFPYYNLNWSGFQVLRSLSGWAYTDHFFMFNTFDNYTVVIQKDYSNYSDLLYSVYNCTNLYPVRSGSSYYYDFNSFCSLLDGGRISGILPFTDRTTSTGIVRDINGCVNDAQGYAGIFNRITAGTNPYFNVDRGMHNSNPFMYWYINGSLSSSHNLCVRSYNTSYSCRGTFNTYYTAGGSPVDICISMTSENGIDLLSNFNNLNVSLSQEEMLQKFCEDNNLFGTNPYCSGSGSYDDFRCVINSSGSVVCYITDVQGTTPAECPTINSGNFTQYRDYTGNRCYSYYSNLSVDSSPGPYSMLTDGTELIGIENRINLAFSDIFSGDFKFYSCPFNSPLKAFGLSSIGGLSSFLLDKFFDVNLVGPFNCLLGGILYSEISSESLGSSLLSYDGTKYFESFPDNVKQVINWLLFAGMILFFWAFRPKDH